VGTKYNNKALKRRRRRKEGLKINRKGNKAAV
jgi:hypothetical protein